MDSISEQIRNSNPIILILGVVVVAIVIAVAGLLLYKFVLRKLFGGFLDSIINMIPIIGPWITKEGFGVLADSISAANLYVGADRNRIGTRSSKGLGHGRPCNWDPTLCNVWPKINRVVGEEKEDENMRIEDEGSRRSILYQQLQEPQSRKVFRNMSFKNNGGLPDMYKNQTKLQISTTKATKEDKLPEAIVLTKEDAAKQQINTELKTEAKNETLKIFEPYNGYKPKTMSNIKIGNN